MPFPKHLRSGALALLTATCATIPFTGTAHASVLRGSETPTGLFETVTTESVIACPLDGESEFIDSWGAARSGGRSHQGVDMIADRGTPIVAVQAGEAQFKQSNLGGNAIWLTTADGTKFYYAHLDGFEGSSRTVERGEVIGYVGSTGNANGPHLHFETHFDGTVGNPYQPTYDACVQPVLDALEALNAERVAAQASVTITSVESRVTDVAAVTEVAAAGDVTVDVDVSVAAPIAQQAIDVLVELGITESPTS